MTTRARFLRQAAGAAAVLVFGKLAAPEAAPAAHVVSRGVMEREITVPVGTVQMFTGNKIPRGWLLCDGSKFDRTAYPQLAAFLYAERRPDLRGRVELVAAGTEKPLGQMAYTAIVKAA